MFFKPLQTLLVFCVLFFLFFFSASETLAGNIYLPLGQSAPSQTCSITSGPGSCDPAPTFCWNSERAGVTDCGAACDGGDPWTKYNLLGCLQTTFDECDNYYEPTQDAVCSTADKCTSTTNNPYLNAGSCSCSVGSQYKTCCTNTTPSLVSGNSCVQLSVDTTNPPFEGVCPAGSSPVFCGFGDNPPCGQEACGPVSVPPPPPPPAPSLTTFSGVSANGATTCFQAEYTASLSWSGTALPASDSSCANGYWVDVDDNSSFSSYSNKCVTGTSTSAPSGFGGPGGAFTFQKGTTYYARVYNG